VKVSVLRLRVDGFSGNTTPCRMTGVTLHSRVRYGMVSDVGCRVSGLPAAEAGRLGFGFMVSGFGYRVDDFGCQMSGFGFYAFKFRA